MIKEIKYKNYKVKVRKMSLKQAKSENAYGLYLSEKSAIYIQNNLNPKNYFKILLHELAHFIFDKAETKPNSEESFAILSEEFLTIFLQNPELLNSLKLLTKKYET
jgi:Zn-dependent peptidase ImmA (M78 family)